MWMIVEVGANVSKVEAYALKLPIGRIYLAVDEHNLISYESYPFAEDGSAL